MSENSSIHNKTFKSVPIDSNKNVPLVELGRIYPRKYISKNEIERLAIEKYKTSGEGTDFIDIIRVFSCRKDKAQRILKDCCSKTIYKAGEERRPVLFRAFRRTSPQKYFPFCIKADIIEDFKKRKNVPIHPTAVGFNKTPSLNLEQQRAQSFLDVLLRIPFAPLCIHKIQIQLYQLR